MCRRKESYKPLSNTYHFSFHGIIEPLQKADGGTFTTPAGSHQSESLSSFHGEREAA